VSFPRFLVDENLSVQLPSVAHAHGYEAIHVNHRGLHEAADWEILNVVEKEEWVLVTNNAIEFRGRFRKLKVHPGVIFLIPSVPRSVQIELLHAALDEIDQDPDTVNTALDVFYEGERIRVNRYLLP
jgi:predicted nuclease of predicted toxin-antitoxin system